MTNASRARKPSKSKKPARKSKGRGNPVLDIVNSLDDDLLAMLRHVVQKELGFCGPEMFDLKDPVDLFAEFLENCVTGKVDAHAELLPDLVAEFGDLKIDANGGDRAARKQIQAIYDLLDDAIGDHSLHPIEMMMIAKVFTDAGWAVPDGLRQAMVEALRASSPDTQGFGGMDLLSSLLEAADRARQNPFDVHEHLNSLLAGFPPEVSAMLLVELVAGKKSVIDQAVVGFVLHPDAVLAHSAAETLAASAAETPVESSMIERFVRMRPWLPQARWAHLDATIRTMRLNALPPARTKLPKIIKCHVSVCDGSGTSALFVTQRLGARYQLASVMMKSSGVADATVFPGLSKPEMDHMVRRMKSSVSVSETDLAGIARMLGLALADNVASGTPPPFKLVEVVEGLGLGQVHPDHASPTEIITGLLALLSPEESDPTAVARAHVDLLGSDLTYEWFEAGEALDDLLHPVKGSRQRVSRLMKSYLPERRLFWARQCAISALAMRGNDEKVHHSTWKQLALVGRDIASDLPLERIPLMKQVAEISVRAFEARP